MYTEKALRYGISGIVRVLVTIGADGSVRDPEVRRSLGYGLDEAALDAVRRTKFAPATRNGLPVTVRVSVDVTFDIH
jgi:protein TonB